MATTDIVARLQLRAEQFSSEAGAAAANVVGVMTRAAAEIRQPFASAFAEVNSLAQTSIKMPRTDAGSLDLSQQIEALHAEALAADRGSIALRELSVAMQSASTAAGVDAQQMMLEADAAAVGSLAQERSAQATRDRIVALEAVQGELAKSKSAVLVDAGALDESGHAANRASIAKMEMMHVVRSSSDAFAAGAPPMQIFAMELGRVAEAASLAGGEGDGKLAVLGRFLGGPWGMAITVAVAVAGPLVAKLFEGGDAAKQMHDNLEKAAAAADSFGSAETMLGKVIDLTTGKMKTQNAVLIETIKLQAQTNILAAQKKAKDDTQALKTISAPSDVKAALSSMGDESGLGIQRSLASQGAELSPLKTVLDTFSSVANNPTASTKDFAAAVDTAIVKLDALGKSGKLAGKDLANTKAALLALGTDRNDIDANKQVVDVLNGGPIPDDLKPYKKDPKPKKEPKPHDYSRADETTGETIARINAEWTETPTLVKKAAAEHLKLDDILKDLERRKPSADVEKLKAAALAAGQAIDTGLNRPYTDFIKSQRESYAVQQLEAQGRTVDAEALQEAVRLQKQMGPLGDAQLANIYAIAKQHEKIAQFLDAQRRVVSLYTGAVGDLRNAFDQAASKAQDGNLGGAVTSLAGGYINTIKTLQRNILSETIFGGVDDAVQKYVRSITGQQTPAEIVQAHAQGFGLAIDDFATMVRVVTGKVGDAISVPRGASPSAANDNSSSTGPDIIVTGTPKPNMVTQDLLGVTKMSSVLGVAFDRMAKNLETLGIKIPASITKTLSDPDVLKGMGIGAAAGGVFSSITGGKDNPLADSIGGAIGEKFGSKLEKPLGDIFGKTLGGLAGPLGGILGGVLGSVVGGLLTSPKWADSTVSLNAQGRAVGGTASGNGSSAISNATGESSSVAAGINQLALQLGARISDLPAMTLGTFNGNYRVADLATTASLNANNFQMGQNLHDFGGDQQAAVEYAVRYSISHAVITGISQASKNILADGSEDLQSAVTKALMIESVPKDLKAMLDPVGAAVDALNQKWQQTVDALNEGGATAQQMADAQRLYNLQLDQTKASTDAADKTLKDFQTSLMLGSSSAYSLRDQEGTAMAALQPYLDQIDAGKTIDQSKYQTAAQAYLDVERSLYGSTDKYFVALDAVQASTNKAIASIDNVSSLAPDVASPFASATADNTAATASGVATGNDIAVDTNTLLQQLVASNGDIAAAIAALGGSDFIGADRLFLKTG